MLNNVQDSSRDIRIGIWGTKGSGKTIYLSMLYDILEASPQKWLVAADPEARRFVNQHRRDMDNTAKAGVLPLPSERFDEITIFSYILKPQQIDIPASRIVLEFIDAPGEFYEHLYNTGEVTIRRKKKFTSKDKQIFDNEYDEVESEYKGIVDYLMSCDGIVFLLDPKPSFQDGNSYRSLLVDLFQEFQERSQRDGNYERLEQYMAFCVTKVDDDDNLWSQAKDPQKLALELMGAKMLQRLQTYCYLEPDKEKRDRLHKHNRCEFFAVSAIGRYRDSDGKWRKAIDNPSNQEKQPDIQQPENPTSQTHYSAGYDPDDFFTNTPNNSEPNIPNTPPETEGFGFNINNTSNWEQQTGEQTIKQGVECQSINVIEPIEWLIGHILHCPPKLINR